MGVNVMMKCGEEHCRKDCPLKNVKSITVGKKQKPVEKCNGIEK
jgi:hypothetical protein